MKTIKKRTTRSTQAMAPEFFRPASEAVKKVEPKKEDEDILLTLAESEGWKQLKKIVSSIQDEINTNAQKSVGKSKSWEEVSKIYYGRDVSIDAMQSIVNLVDLRKHAKDFQDEESTREQE